MPSNKWGEWQVYMEAYKAGLIDRVEALKKTEIFDKEGVLQRNDTIAQLQAQIQQYEQQLKKVQGDLQTAHRESVSSRKRTEVEKFKGKLKEIELDERGKTSRTLGKLDNAVNLETERLRIRGQTQNKSSKE